MDLKLTGNLAVITGGASGIGLATARLFAEEGCSLELWDISPSLNEVADELRAIGVSVSTRMVDVIDGDQVMRATTDCLAVHRRINHVVHCAAIGSGKYGFPFTHVAPQDWTRTLEVNILGMAHIAAALTPTMVQRRSGTFVFLASIAGQIGSQTDPPYSASKAANINFAQCMAKDLAPHNIRVNSVSPGMVKTPLNRSVWQSWFDRTEPKHQLSYEDWADRKIKNIVPLGRWQTCEDVASMIVFLSSDRAKEVTGQTINVDGGCVMHS
ncbi:SDR family NAD(P)-dependent oxidoreductase [Neorhodopirellula pilleata]|uniref:3-oxoacyl-[acyl-carrier-protein] reductase FabG n=1 Tax=Neorhodopirellula pilleata TaxID=2714738 RepID=A0A5C6A4W8_9BACT|nr:SDR family oxidoreductase [Neorhodopirellula pilleata]TWT95012.1 3-oxoacyl-[acyl-carrier-protein] reductase FabG [Neorhodopirellula pilleata]